MEGSVSYSGSLRNCAMVCSLRRVKHKCKEKFGSYACNNCRYNICEYADIDPQQAKLFVMQTDFEAQDTVSYNRTTDIVFWFFILGFLALGLHSFNYYHPGELGKYVPSYFKQVVEKSVQVQALDIVKAEEKPPKYPNRYKAVEATLDEVAIRMVLGQDVDKDGVINCHDSSTWFYYLYPYRDEVKIMANSHDLNHLFVSVLLDGKWVCIEPWIRYSNRDPKASYYMQDVWGKRYDHRYCKDVTQSVLRAGWTWSLHEYD